jgi:hypothetical protein
MPIATVLCSSTGMRTSLRPSPLCFIVEIGMVTSLCPSPLCLYIRSWNTVSPSSLDSAQCESQLFVCTVAKKLTLEGKSFLVFKFFLFRCVFEAIFKLKFLGFHNHFFCINSMFFLGLVTLFV